MKDSRVGGAGLFHLLVIYLVWGSTYLAIRVAVREGAGFPPFTLAAMRVLAASVVLFAWAALARQRLLPSRRDWPVLVGTGLLLWTGGNGLVTWAERHADSGLAALIVGALPLWGALIEAVIDRRSPGWRTIAALLLGFLGVSVLSYPVLREGSAAELWSVLALLGAPLSWAIGSIWLQRRRPELGLLSSSAIQQLAGGAGFLVLMLLTGESLPRPTGEAWAALAYLTVFGSVFAFTSYVRALQLLPINVVMTYAYVNPVVAVFLGWLLLREAVTGWTLAGAVLVVAGVAGVFHERYGRGRGPTGTGDRNGPDLPETDVTTTM